MGQNSRQHWSAQRYAETAHFVPALGAPVLKLLAPEPGEHILDLGCGDGVLTEKIAAAGATSSQSTPPPTWLPRPRRGVSTPGWWPART